MTDNQPADDARQARIEAAAQALADYHDIDDPRFYATEARALDDAGLLKDPISRQKAATVADDDLRAKLTEALDAHRIVSFSRDGVRCECAHDAAFSLMQWDEHRRHVADALAPVIRDYLADAWEAGLDAGAARWMDEREFGDEPVNPWRS